MKPFYKRNLPHFQSGGYAFFIKFRLTGTLPLLVVEKLKKLKEDKLKEIAAYDNQQEKIKEYNNFKRKYFLIYDEYLDKAAHGHKWLQQKNVAAIVKGSLHSFDEKDYYLIAYCIMSNHVHLVIWLNVERDLSRSLNSDTSNNLSDSNFALQYPVAYILKKIKGSTARECNKLLNRSGKFWQHESYDHAIRNNESLKRVVKYVLNNPVKAGLVENWEDYEWNYCNEKYLI